MQSVFKILAGLGMALLTIFILSNYFSNYPPGYKELARQSEAKTNLSSIATAEIAYMVETGSWSGSFEEIGWSPVEKNRYVYFISPAVHRGKSPEELGLDVPLDVSKFKPAPGVPSIMLTDEEMRDVDVNRRNASLQEGFTAVAIGNIDDDDTLDVWYITNERNPINVVNDVKK